MCVKSCVGVNRLHHATRVSDILLCTLCAVRISPHSRRWCPTKALFMRLVYIAKDKSSILLQISKTTTLPPMRNSRTLEAVVNKSSILLRISKITALPPTRNSRTLTAVAKMSFALKPIYNSTTMRNTQSKYSFVLLVCTHVTAFLVFLISHFLSFT